MSGSSYEYPDYNGEEYEYNDYKDYQEGETAQIPVNMMLLKDYWQTTNTAPCNLRKNILQFKKILQFEKNTQILFQKKTI